MNDVMKYGSISALLYDTLSRAAATRPQGQAGYGACRLPISLALKSRTVRAQSETGGHSLPSWQRRPGTTARRNP